MLKKAGLLFASLLLLAPLGFSQYNRIDVAISGGGLFSKQVEGNNVTQTATNGTEVFLTARYRFSAKSSAEFTYGRAGNSQIYNAAFDYRIQSNISEYSGAYVFSPIETRNFELFFLGGVGGLKFHPYNEFIEMQTQPVSGSTNTQLAVIYGGGFDYKLFTKIPIISHLPSSSRFAIRLQYRGFLYRAPSFDVPGIDTSAHGHIAEPSLGLVYKF
jgi:outer membrane immunogenic protein